ncbi:uncharacterized protein UTRI_02644 [Ustilago trichophora]|uniref:Uncharacterized protein n=1 Tax=Ustilago trichophora TaxID=86804 RepID=A0A5C3EQM5_9BASI|nr:uncharacterized protein UTRI_02644 [Ustilago trichophora]
MLARSSGRLLAQTSITVTATRPTIRLATPFLTRNLLTARSITSSPIARNTVEQDDPEKANHFHRLEYMLSEPSEPNQITLVSELQDDQISFLPLVIRAHNLWQPPPSGLPLPLRENPSLLKDPATAHLCPEFLYNSFHFPSQRHLQRFHRELVSTLQGKFRKVEPVLLLDPSSKTLTIGLPSHVGIQPPYPARENANQVKEMLEKYRAEQTSEQEKRDIAKKMRSYAIPHGFKHHCHAISFYLSTLFNSVRNVAEEEIGWVNFSNMGTLEGSTRTSAGGEDASSADGVEESVPVDVGSNATKGIAKKASKEWRRDRRNKQPKGAAKPTAKKQQSMADRLRSVTPKVVQDGVELKADDPRLPEAGTFVAQDGDKHKVSDGVDTLEEHVPFPNPTAEEMGIKKPTET